MPLKELGFEPWIYKLHERLSIIGQNIKTGQNLQEADIDILQALYVLHFNGEIVFHEVIEKPDKTKNKLTFSDKKTVKP